MKTQDYQEMLRAVERALEVCDRSSGFMDQVHREICERLQVTRTLLLQLIGAPG